MKIFMSYRREDSPAVADRIAAHLRREFGPDNVFQDVDSLGLGEDFLNKIQAALTAADVLIAVIGPNWLSVSNRSGRRRLDDPDDWVRIEVREALQRDDVRVVPLLVEGAAMPSENDLPPGLKALAHRNAYTVRSDPDSDVGLENLVARLKQILTDATPAPAPTAAVIPRATVTPAPPRTSPPAPVARRMIKLATTWKGIFLSISMLGLIAISVILVSPRLSYTPNPHPGTNGAASPPPQLPAAVTVRSPTDRDSPAPLKVATEGIAKEKEAAPAGPPAPMHRTDRDSAAPPRQITNSISMKLVLIPAGEFMMGSDETDPDAEDDEVVVNAAGKKEKHRVRITRPFYLGATEVTRGQFLRFVHEAGYQTEAETDGKGGVGWNEAAAEPEQDPKYTWRNPGFPRGIEQTDEHPVVNVSWNDAMAFCEWLSQKEGRSYRLPTEAEWEYACRAGTTKRYSFGDDPDRLPQYAWVLEFRGSGTHPVGQRAANRWGLFDMHGNVWEWCRDRFARDYYQRSPTDDPQGPEGASARRVMRGGSWTSNALFYVRAASRRGDLPSLRWFDLGFRCGEFSSVR